MIRRFRPDRKSAPAPRARRMHDFYANPGPDPGPDRRYRFLVLYSSKAMSRNFGEVRAMRLTIEIIAAVALLFCLTATSAAFAAGKPARSADGLSCSFNVAKDASPAARCAAIRKQ